MIVEKCNSMIKRKFGNIMILMYRSINVAEYSHTDWYFARVVLFLCDIFGSLKFLSYLCT